MMWAMVSSMEITSLQELAHCREQILLLRNRQVLPCQAGEHWDGILLIKPWNLLNPQQFLMTI
uniref:Alternative protein ABI1 n=1 Tax=Homo sapiens TaxID=9606 RepID=L8EC66_HUMAN|nr:alternative protein ABI1 [Homo sapiens]